ncbi:MAG TPA: ATP-binding protein, partial [Verrucomicrobiae bacterium]
FQIPPQLPDRQLSTEVRHNIFLAVKEILNNALKHSEARRLTLKFSVSADAFEISIKDDGHGMASEPADTATRFKRTGHGLANLRERLAAINGRFEIRSEPGGGTEILLTVPLGKHSLPLSSIHTTRNGTA